MNLQKNDQTRVLRDRRTGRLVGAWKFFPEDDPYLDLPPDEKLWRYMPVEYFHDLLKRRRIFFNRGDKFQDYWEGRESPGNEKGMSRSDQEFYGGAKIVRNRDAEKLSIEMMRRWCFISCWDHNTSESERMWREYSPDPSGVLISSTVGALKACMPERTTCSLVAYRGLDFPRTAMGHTTFFYFKPDYLSFEQEYRFLHTLSETETLHPDAPQDQQRYIPVSLAAIMSVTSHPNATRGMKAHVDGIVSKHVPHLTRKNSSFEA